MNSNKNTNKNKVDKYIKNFVKKVRKHNPNLKTIVIDISMFLDEKTVEEVKELIKLENN